MKDKDEIIKKIHQEEIDLYSFNRYYDWYMEPICWCFGDGDASTDISGYYCGEDDF